MAKVYRVAPEIYCNLIIDRAICRDAVFAENPFYQLGYIVNDKRNVYFNLSDPMEGKVNTFDNSVEGKYFFLYPWSAVENGLYIRNSYHRDMYYVMEYEIPDEIIEEHLGFGFYKGYAHPEVFIPNDILLNGSIKFSRTSDLSQKLRELILKNFELCAQKLNSLKKYNNVVIDNELKNKMVNIMFECLETAYSSSFPTGKHVSFCANEVIKNLGDLKSLIPISEGLLTQKTLEIYTEGMNMSMYEQTDYVKSLLKNRKL